MDFLEGSILTFVGGGAGHRKIHAQERYRSA